MSGKTLDLQHMPHIICKPSVNPEFWLTTLKKIYAYLWMVVDQSVSLKLFRVENLVTTVYLIFTVIQGVFCAQ